MKKCVIISGAPLYDDNELDFLKNRIDKDSFIICADSGYKKCEYLKIIPNLIIGDFDSADYPSIDTVIIKLEKEKEYTDTFHCVIEAVKRGFDYIEIFCAIGDRIDHTYSNILCLNYCKNHNVKCYITNSKNRLSLIFNETKVYKEYKYFSLFAYLEECKEIKISGAYYTAGFYDKETLDFDLDTQCGQSNYVIEEYATISLKSGCLLLIESND